MAATTNFNLLAEISEIGSRISSKGRLLMPVWRADVGYDLAKLQWVFQEGYKVVGELSMQPQYCIAAQTPRFSKLLVSAEQAAVLQNTWRRPRGLNLEITTGAREALKRSMTSHDAAVVCTVDEANGYRFGHQYSLSGLSVEQKFFLVSQNLPSAEQEKSLFVVNFNRDLVTTLKMITHYCQEHQLTILDMVKLPKTENSWAFWLDGDYRMAKVRKLVNYAKDLQLAEFIVCGSYSDLDV